MKYFLILTISLLVISCAQKEPEQDMMSNPEVQTEEGIIEISEQQFTESGFVLDTITYRNVSDKIPITGHLHVPEKYQASVSSNIEGKVEYINLLPGEYVRKGQELVRLSNPILIDLQENYLVLKSELSYLKSELSRMENLLPDQLVAEKDYLKIMNDFAQINSKLNATRSKMSLYGISIDELDQGSMQNMISLSAPISGFVDEVKAIKGQYLKEGESAITITDNSHIHVELMVMEKDITKLKIGQELSFFTQSEPEKERKAKIHLIENTFNEDRLILVHCHIQREDKAGLVPGMYINAELILTEEKSPVLPEEAFVKYGDRYVVLKYIEGSRYSFEKLSVESEQTFNGFRKIEMDPAETEQSMFLVKGAYYIVLN